MSETVIQFNDVKTGYGDKEIIKGLSNDIKKGEFVDLIGSNGAGKSTLLKAVSGINPLDGGTITIQGKDNASLTPRDRAKEVAVVPQSFDVDYDFTVRDIVMMGRNPYIGPRDRESDEDRGIVEDALKRTDTLKFADRYFNTLSGGERQKVILARAIAQQTDIILLDEPTSALDLHRQIEVMELIEELNKNGVTVLAVLHDLNLAARYCSRMLLINDGNIIADGTPKEVMTQKNLKQIYDMKMIIRNNPLFNKPEVIPVSVLKEEQTGKGKKVHLIAGAETATYVIEKLDNKGFTMSAGVVPKGSADYETLSGLGIETITVNPFSPVTIDLQRKNLDLAKDADYIFIADIPFGEMNILNLLDLESLDGEIYIHEHALKSDFTDGRLKKRIDEISEIKPVHIVKDYDHFIQEAEKQK